MKNLSKILAETSFAVLNVGAEILDHPGCTPLIRQRENNDIDARIAICVL